MKKVYFSLMILFVSCLSNAQEKEQDSIQINILRARGVFTFPFYSNVKIDGEKIIRLESGTYAMFNTKRKESVLSISEKEYINIKKDIDQYYLVIVFRKRLFWSKQDLIQVTKEYYESFDLSDYLRIRENDKNKKWY